MQKVRVTRFECFHVSASWKSKKKSWFYLELARDGTKEEQAARKTLANLLTKEKRQEKHVYHQLVEGTGYVWRVEASIIAKYANRLDLPCTLEEELARFRREGIHRPSEPIMVQSVSIPDLDRPHIISLQLNAPNETLRRALDQYREDHCQSKDDWTTIGTSGANITITRSLLQVFLDWFSFERSLGVMLKEAMKEAQESAERMKQYHKEQREREKEQEQEREHQSREWFNEFMRRRKGYYYYQYSYSYQAPRRTNEPTITEALKTFGLSSSATLQDVKKKYRVLAKLYHPDAGGDAEKFKKVNAANQVLMKHFS